MNATDMAKTLAEYSPTVSRLTNDVVAALTPMALVLIGIFCLIEMDSWWKSISQEGGGLTQEVWLQLAYKYLLAFMLVMLAPKLFDAMLEVSNMAVRIVDSVFPWESKEYRPELGKIKGYVNKTIISLLAWVIEFIVKISIKLISLMMYLEMYLIKAVSPLLIAFFMADGTRNIAINVMKQFGSIAFQGILVILVSRMYVALVTDDLLKINLSGSGASNTIAFASIAKGIIFIFLLWSTQKKAKSLLNAM